MSALSYVMIKRGYQVSGSDAKPGYMATNLAKEGALVSSAILPARLNGRKWWWFLPPSIRTTLNWWKPKKTGTGNPQK